MKTKTPKIDLADCPSCVSFNIRKAMRAVSQHYDQIMAPSGLRGTQFTILTALNILGDLTITDLAEYLVMERTTLTRNLKPLEKERYLKVLPGPQDSRTRRVNLTAAGKKAQKAAMPYWQKAQDEMVDYLGKSNAKQFISDLQVAAKSREQI